MVVDIKNYILGKLFFPKRIVMNKPGVILSKVVKKYGKEFSRGRLAYIFEDTLAGLQLDTIEKVGSNETSEIWYKIGKDSMASYFLVTNAKKPPFFLLESVLKYILGHLFVTGASIGSNVDFDSKNMSLVLRGENNAVYRKSGVGDVFSGMVSSIVSFLIGTNVEAEISGISDKDSCIIICNKKIPKKYIPNYGQIRSSLKSYNLVVPGDNSIKMLYEYNYLTSFDKLLKFRRAVLIDNITYFENEAVITAEINTADHIINNYISVGILDLLKKSVIDSNKRKIKKIIEKKKLSQEEKLKFIQNMMSAFGWGIPIYKIKDDKIIFDFIFGAQAITNTFLFYALQLNGFLNYIFNKDVKLIEVKMNIKRFPVSTAVYEI